jgi:hypothetical protein
MTAPVLPAHAVPFFGQLPWDDASKHQVNWRGLPSGHFFTFAGATPAMFAMTQCNVDTDGPFENSQVDPCWQPGTSLATAAGTPVSSKLFPGVVMPPELREYGVRMGDFGVAEWNGKLVPFQFYDGGPHDQFCECSLYLTRQLGITPTEQSDHSAAVAGNDVSDLCLFAFPGSGPDYALELSLIPLAVHVWLTGFGDGALDL